MTATDEQRLASWIEANIGGRVVRVEHLQRWRPGWNIDLEIDGAVLALHARGDRELNFAIPCRIAGEVPIHDMLEVNGLPVPHAYGLCDDPYSLVMDRLRGDVDLTFAASDDERTQLIEEYLSMLPKIYGISGDDLARAGFAVPTTAEGVALDSFGRFEKVHDELMEVRDPVAEFLRRWLHHNYPHDRDQATFVTYDAFQFMFEHGRITGLLDFELACVGDPMMDLAALRVRDTIKNLGDLSLIAHGFEVATGMTVDHDAVDYHSVMYNTLTVLSAAPPIVSPIRTTDYVSHCAWYVNSARWAFADIAEMRGFTLDTVAVPASKPSRHGPSYTHLATALKARSAEAPDDYEVASLYRHARHLRRVDEIGAALLAADLDDLAALLGRRVDAAHMDLALLDFIDGSGEDEAESLVKLLDRRVQRMHLLLAPTGSLLLRHPPLRNLRHDVEDRVDDSQRWPAGAIPGTRSIG
ncbi:MAG: phosphotransferase [Actinomycetota bacterium]|nr:phosphotransferase [Actinomycetota bacterium]